MSCNRGAEKVSLIGRMSCGIGQLAGKRGFYAGLALGSTGLLGAGLVALSRWRTRARPDSEPPWQPVENGPEPDQPAGAGFNLRAIPQLPTRTKLKPVARPLAATEQCVTCRTPANTKPGPWYHVGGRLYCQDCAPEAARQAEVDLVAPEPPAINGIKTDRLPAWRDTIGLPAPAPAHLPVERRVNTQLRSSRVRVYAGEAADGPAFVVVRQGFVVVRPDRHNPDGVTDTGLAVVPGLKVDGSGAHILEDTAEWHLVHIQSGKTIPGATYGSLAQAGLLAGVLAQLDWNRAEGELSTAEIRQVGATISLYNQSLTRQVQAEAQKPLVGQLVADNSGGLARVLDDQGELLLLVDSLGRRYEVARAEIRPPEERDFELMRVAQSIDPRTRPGDTCARCSRPAREAEPGSTWYRMARQSFCPTCATAYAAEEAYLKDDEINAELEPMPS